MTCVECQKSRGVYARALKSSLNTSKIDVEHGPAPRGRFFMIFGSIWDASGEPLGSFVGSKMLRKIMFVLNAFCMLSGSRAGGTQAGSTGGAGG